MAKTIGRKETVAAAGAPAAIGPYSQAVRAGSWLFLSGQIPIDPPTGALVPGGVKEQTERVLKNIGAILQSQGLDYADVVKTTVYLMDMGQFAEMNEVYGRYFKSAPPARATVQVAALPKGALVEIEAVAAA